MQEGPENSLVMDSIIASFIRRSANITGDILDSERFRNMKKREKGKNRKRVGEKAYTLVLPLPIFRPNNLANTEVSNMSSFYLLWGLKTLVVDHELPDSAQLCSKDRKLLLA